MELETESYAAEVTLERRSKDCVEILSGGRLIGHIALVEDPNVDYMDDGDLQTFLPKTVNKPVKERLEGKTTVGVEEKETEQSMVEEVREILYSRAEANDVNPEEFFEDIRLQDDAVLVETERIGYFGHQTSEALKEKNYEVSRLDESVFDDNKAVFLRKVTAE